VYVRDFLRQNHIHIENTQTPEQAIALVRDHAVKGADGIKLFTGSDLGHGEVALLPLATAKAAVDEAHRHHMPVFAHPTNVAGNRQRMLPTSFRPQLLERVIPTISHFFEQPSSSLEKFFVSFQWLVEQSETRGSVSSRSAGRIRAVVS
jgi:hypothetical protein